jgi:hypothetical protein
MTKVAQINSLHDEAMKLAGQAFHADLHGDFSAAEEFFRKAFDLEQRAALLLADDTGSEPTRSVLLRSAASLAVDCREFREAERLVAIGLSGNPPHEIADELRDLLETVYFSRHLSLRGLELDPLEFQMSLVGGSIGFGVAESSQFLRRAETLERMLVRTIERLRGVPFRETGSPSRTALEGFEIFYSVPRAASFALTIRLGRPQRQMLLQFPDMKGPGDVVEDLLDCIAQFNAEQVEALQHHIDSEPYFNNFTALAKKLGPDGDKVTAVGFTSIKGEEKKEVALTQPAGPIWRPRVEPERRVEIVGRIRSADETSKRGSHPVFGVEDDGGKTQTVSVLPGVLQDIVKPYWGERVRVFAAKVSKSRLQMIDLQPAEAE